MALRWYGTPEAEAFLRDAANSSLPHTRRCAEEEVKCIEKMRASSLGASEPSR
jgi:hypothetical protein